MKNLSIQYLILVMFFFCSHSAIAQIEIANGGQVTMGGTPATRPNCVTLVNGGASGNAFYVLGNATATDPAAYIYGGTAAGYSIEVMHNNTAGFSCGVNTDVPNSGCNSYGLDVAGSNVFYVSGGGWIYVNGTYYTSDSSLKTNIIKLRNPLDQINKLSGYTYYYKKTVLDSGIEKGKTFYPDSSLHAGVMAQEVEKVAPYMVKTMMNGKKAVDYLQLVPLLLEGLKQEDSVNKDLKNRLNLLQSRFNNLAQSIDTSGGNFKLTSNTTNASSSFALYQNSPNPFNTDTKIAYLLKGSYSSASIYIFDLQGSLKKSYLLDNSGSLTVKASDLSPGMFIYSLVVDGNQIDIKRMILTN